MTYCDRRERYRILALLRDHPEWSAPDAVLAIEAGYHHDDRYLAVTPETVEPPGAAVAEVAAHGLHVTALRGQAAEARAAQAAIVIHRRLGDDATRLLVAALGQALEGASPRVGERRRR